MKKNARLPEHNSENNNVSNKQQHERPNKLSVLTSGNELLTIFLKFFFYLLLSNDGNELSICNRLFYGQHGSLLL